jgi:3-methyladenine DNA glycosylase Tag
VTTPFAAIWDRAAARKGGDAALKALLPTPAPPAELAVIPDARWLAGMAKRIFQAGFNWGVVENKWPGFEAAFAGFEPRRVRMFSDEDLDRLAKDAAIVRNPQKIAAVRDNAVFLADLALEHGSAAGVFAGWASDDYAGLLDLMNRRGARLGGMTGQIFLRGMGKDSWIISGDVATALIREGVVDKRPTSKSGLKAVQSAFNAWMAESGRGLTQISRILAMGVDTPHPGQDMTPI